MRRILSMIVLLLSSVLPAQAEEGFASWYAGKFQGRQTASGEIFDTEKYTAAHKTLQFGTMVRVTNLDNQKSTVVRINDRGPFVQGRIIDLSRVAAQDLDMLKTGIARVSVEVVKSPSQAAFCQIQVASFKDHENAKRLGRTLNLKGYSVVYEIASAGNLRVIMEAVPAEKLAEAKALLASLGFSNVIVR
ncbi:MAG: septal ring lytic transglycosylase RlpA family protein [Spirochaetaceae bacterium]|nr:MAG: septal ring lytic transglycosylase RlpA family protein [Spirochaetaceae bacterium]